MKPVITILRSGPYSTLQDLGRNQCAHLGVTTGGPADEYAFLWANKLLDNSMNCSVIEVTLGNLHISTSHDCMLALAGADMDATIDGVSVGNWKSFKLAAQSTLKLKTARVGLRAYLAIQEGFIAPSTLGSQSTVLREHLGGLDGSGTALKKGAILPFNPCLELAPEKQLSFNYIPTYSQHLNIGVIESEQSHAFTNEQKDHFYNQDYTIHQDSNRMGIRLDGESIGGKLEPIESEGIALGAIQFPPSGQPIILLQDRQTIGGYPKLGCVARSELWKLGQVAPGYKIRFRRIKREDSQKVWSKWARYFNY